MGHGHGVKADYLGLPTAASLVGSGMWKLRGFWLRLGWEALATGWAFRPLSWWRKPPFLPIPEPSYVQWRAYTAYGDPMKAIAGADLVSFLGWRIRFSRYVRTVTR